MVSKLEAFSEQFHKIYEAYCLVSDHREDLVSGAVYNGTSSLCLAILRTSNAYTACDRRLTVHELAFASSRLWL